MNDEEINEIIARSEEEERIFRDMDIQRDRESGEAWKAAGHRGKPPLPLMQLEELPDCYRQDDPFEDKTEMDEMEGRGHRKRTTVNYNDGLSDDQWAMVSRCDGMFDTLSLCCILGSGRRGRHPGAVGAHARAQGSPRREQGRERRGRARVTGRNRHSRPESEGQEGQGENERRPDA